jgi:hypothetical protein
MVEDFKTDQELARLESMHERVQKLRSRLKDLELDTYGALGITGEEQHKDADGADGAAK